MALVARVSRYQGDPQRIEDGIRFVLETDISQMAGNRGAVLLVDRSSGRVMTLTFWDSDQAASGSAGAAASLREQIAQAFGAGAAPTTETYEVVSPSRFPPNA
jgi:heme-degrading monooxygenase HmoA